MVISLGRIPKVNLQMPEMQALQSVGCLLQLPGRRAAPLSPSDRVVAPPPSRAVVSTKYYQLQPRRI